MSESGTPGIEQITRDLQRFTEGPGAEATALDLVRVTLDGRMQVSAVRILDDSVPAETRERLEQAFAEAMRAAQADLVRQAGEALTRPHDPPW
ncbi:MAG: YbaB/EbfC family nucleoid-associated protein [Acidimicrobiales bacterium]